MGLRILLLTTDAYGGHGGIAYYNRCLAEAIAEMPDVEEVMLLVRSMRFAPEGIPAKVRFVKSAAGGKLRYVLAAVGLIGERIDLVICGHINLLHIAAPLALLKRAKLILQVHGIDAWQPVPRMRFWLGKVAAIWSVSSLTRDRMNAWVKLPESMYTIIPNTVHQERYGLSSKRADLVARYGLEGRRVIATLARLAEFERYKGIDETLEVMPQLLEQEPGLIYMVLGDGDDQARLEAKAKALGIKDAVIFAGFISESEKSDYLRLADVFVLPGRGEGFGIVFLEAMACGVPVVGSQIDGSREALRNGLLGELVSPDDLDSVRIGILRSLNKPKEIPQGLSYFAWPAFVQRVADAVRDIGK
ncbi:MAG: glycosyltransferase family 4 protein [Betaproteobacteria bacterium]|nr:glycosyltransferase family 4 protein [Betaproteobacteria bacterium]